MERDRGAAPDVAEARGPGGPSAFLYGPAHLIRYGNPAFREAYGAGCLSQPAREAMTDLPRAAFELMDRVLREGRPLALRMTLPNGERRLVVVPRVDPADGEVYGVAVHLRPATHPARTGPNP
jgi:hypothetical protein